ncbi:galactokinase [Arcanobacterium hippocoleae]
MTTVIEALSDESGAKRVSDFFNSSFGKKPESIWAAPGRVNLIGEHIDYSAGICLPIALNHCTFAAYSARSDGRVRLVSAHQPDKPWEGTISDVILPETPNWVKYAAGAAYILGIEQGFDAADVTCVPAGAGLSSSAAIECAIGMALAEPQTQAERTELAAACVRAENEVAGAPTGGLDQSASLLCSAGNALLLDCKTWETQQVPFELASHGLELLVIDTRAPHSLNDGQYAKRRAACEKACAELGIEVLRDAAAADVARLSPELQPFAKHVIDEIQRVKDTVAALQAADFAAVGKLFIASHNSLRDDYKVSCPELDLAVAAAVETGALGARMTGGGFGGSAIAIVRTADTAKIISAIEKAFAAAGFNEPHFLHTTAGAGARRISETD